MITIDRESQGRILSPIDLDFMGERYKTENTYYTFTSPSLWTIEKYFFYLLKNSKTATFDSKYKYKPDYLSTDEYGTPALENVLMYVNGVFCCEDFTDLGNILIPSFSSIVDICQDKFTPKEIDKMTSVEW